eukprot:TRINITY_DN7765_c0_g1_i1.p2 TRINITY_DN7765_c0_g1~~TRINITY_DN7765_c0_g1_i1.p2  ORF type:complete len:106 (-),score=34.13 TRINITY_DN7765_c0_g1_i1:206-523(-)
MVAENVSRELPRNPKEAMRTALRVKVQPHVFREEALTTIKSLRVELSITTTLYETEKAKSERLEAELQKSELARQELEKRVKEARNKVNSYKRKLDNAMKKTKTT